MYVWLDSETTGLEPEDGELLEVCCKITEEKDTKVLGSFKMVRHWTDWSKVPANVVAMHEKSGLAKECAESQNSLDELAQGLFKFLKRFETKYRTLAGSSVHFDRKFLKEYCRSSYNLLFYRQYDISSLYALFFNIEGFPTHLWGTASSIDHRAEADILASMSIHQHYKDHVTALVELWEACQKQKWSPTLAPAIAAALAKLPNTICQGCHLRLATDMDRKNHDWGPAPCRKQHWCQGRCWGHAG